MREWAQISHPLVKMNKEVTIGDKQAVGFIVGLSALKNGKRSDVPLRVFYFLEIEARESMTASLKRQMQIL